MKKTNYSKDEQETVLVFDPITESWKVESSYGPHITKLMKVTDCEVVTEHESGKPSMIRAEMKKSQISFLKFRQRKPMTDEERVKLAERLRNSRSAEKM